MCGLKMLKGILKNVLENQTHARTSSFSTQLHISIIWNVQKLKIEVLHNIIAFPNSSVLRV